MPSETINPRQLNIMNSFTNKITGKAILCLNDAKERLQGVIQTTEEECYSIYGSRSTSQNNNSLEEENNFEFQNENLPVNEEEIIFNVQIIDCEIDQEYNLGKVTCLIRGEHIALKAPAIKFKTTKIYKGDRAEVERQRIMGCTGDRSKIYEGLIDFSLTEPNVYNEPWVL